MTGGESSNQPKICIAGNLSLCQCQCRRQRTMGCESTPTVPYCVDTANVVNGCWFGRRQAVLNRESSFKTA